MINSIYDAINKDLDEQEIIWIDDDFKKGEDSDLMSFIEELILKNIYFAVFTDVQTALEKMLSMKNPSKIKLVILDARMPGHINLLRFVRSNIIQSYQAIKHVFSSKLQDELRPAEIAYNYFREYFNAKVLMLTGFKEHQDIQDFKELYPEVILKQKFLDYNSSNLIDDFYRIAGMINSKITILRGYVEEIGQMTSLLKMDVNGQLTRRLIKSNLLRQQGCFYEEAFIKITIVEDVTGSFNISISHDPEAKAKFVQDISNNKFERRDKEFEKYISKKGDK